MISKEKSYEQEDIMKKVNSSKTSSMPMLELIIIIGIFAISSIFILQMFLTANTVEQKAKDKSKSVLIAENIVEAIKAHNNFQETMKSLEFSNAAGMVEENADGSYKISKIESQEKIENTDDEAAVSYIKFYNKNWQETDTEDTYCVLVFPSYNQAEAGMMVQAEIYIYRLSPYVLFDFQGKQKVNEELCHLHIANYISKDMEN